MLLLKVGWGILGALVLPYGIACFSILVAALMKHGLKAIWFLKQQHPFFSSGCLKAREKNQAPFINSWELAEDLKYVIAKVCTGFLINGCFIMPNEFYQSWWQRQKINGKTVSQKTEEEGKQRGSGYSFRYYCTVMFRHIPNPPPPLLYLYNNKHVREKCGLS